MSPRRNERAATPPIGDEWEIRFADNATAKGWEELWSCAPANLRDCYDRIRSDPIPRHRTPRHGRLKKDRATREFRGQVLIQWQFEVTAGGRVWYVVDEARQTVWITSASPRHPKPTE